MRKRFVLVTTNILVFPFRQKWAVFLPLVIKGNTHVFPFSVGQPGEAGSADPAEETEEMKTKHSTVY